MRVTLAAQPRGNQLLHVRRGGAPNSRQKTLQSHLRQLAHATGAHTAHTGQHAGNGLTAQSSVIGHTMTQPSTHTYILQKAYLADMHTST